MSKVAQKALEQAKKTLPTKYRGRNLGKTVLRRKRVESQLVRQGVPSRFARRVVYAKPSGLSREERAKHVETLKGVAAKTMKKLKRMRKR